MRSVVWVVVAGCAVALAAAPVRAQGTFPLKYQEAGELDSPVGSHSYHSGSDSPPEGLKAPPKGLSEKALYFSMPVGGKSVWVVIDKTSPPRLFVDAAGTGDMSGAKPIMSATNKGSEPVFGPVTVAPAGTDGPSGRVRFIFYNESMLAVIPAEYMAGEVKLDGQSYRVVVVDNYVTGRYDNVLRLTDKKALWRWETVLAIDLDQDGRFDRVTAAGERLPLLAGVHVKDAYYSVKVAPDGSSITLAKAEPQFGVLDAGCPDLNLVLLGDSGFHNLAGSGGKWRLPAGGHRSIESILARTDAAGATWTLRAGSSDGRFGKFEIRPGETLTAQGGPPLVVDVRADPPMDGAVCLQFGLLTRDGQEYSPGPMKNGQRMPAPKFRILEGSGQVLAQGNFEYG
ncbi:MAG: hypothetical protein IMZ65_01850 [Planctomycetes bacterium]|nr:hypothetical protein [Planctomycetota bacterium]